MRLSSSSPTTTEPPAADLSSHIASRKVLAIGALLISTLYFADTLLRASLKTFWFDEIVTVLLCRLPSFSDTWTAVMHGGDFNPPLFYLSTRWCQHLFGEGLMASRLPAIVGFWVFGICLFIFVRRRLGPLQGCIAALFPVFTLAHNYAYEARPHGSVLGWCGLMLICWQRAREGRSFSLWTLALWLSALGALLTHIYAVYMLVPFLVVEALGLAKGWRPNLGVVGVLLVAPLCVAPLYLRMMHTYRTVITRGGLQIHPYEVIQQFLLAVVGPALIVLLALVLLLAIERRRTSMPPVEKPSRLLPEEVWLAIAFACLPLIGAVGVKLSHGPFFNRYFLASTAGYAILLAQATVAGSRRAFAARGIVAAMLFLLTADTAIAAFCRWHHADLDQIESASRFIFPTSPRQPLQRDGALLRNRSVQDILVTEEHTYLYLYYYAPPALRARLYLGLPDPNDPSLISYRRSRAWEHLDDLRVVSFDQFFATHNAFYVYSPINATLGPTCQDCLKQFLEAGYTLHSVDRDWDNLLEYFSR